jgi:UDP-GlcNAc:undecaprenyl-phosphate GlcNAc-1-phosphate transferase
MNTLLFLSTAIGAAFLALMVLRALAPAMDLLDTPCERKQHVGAIPLVGGISTFVGLLSAWFLWMPLMSEYVVFWLCALLLMVVGALDDARELSARFRLLVQVVLGAVLVVYSGVHITHLGDLVGFGMIELGWVGPFLTIAAIIGATNAFNMSDGIDGLAGSLTLVTLVSLIALYAANSGMLVETMFAAGLALALTPYLMANLRVGPWRCKVFMGDAGSMFIGFSVVWLLAQGVSQDAPAIRPVTALWIIAIPLMDMVAVMIRRLSRGQSVMAAGRDHLHHIFMRAGLSDRETLTLVTLLAIIMAFIGLIGELYKVPEAFMLLAFLMVFVVYELVLRNAWRSFLALSGKE